MYGIAAIIAALVALAITLVGLVPLLGWLNWLALLVAFASIALAVASRKPDRPGEKPRGAMGCLAIFLAVGVIFVAMIRLVIGFGVI